MQPRAGHVTRGHLNLHLAQRLKRAAELCTCGHLHLPSQGFSYFIEDANTVASLGGASDFKVKKRWTAGSLVSGADLLCYTPSTKIGLRP
jgi:hypothetical protein